jgi:S1-C subfamily serine protease
MRGAVKVIKNMTYSAGSFVSTGSGVVVEKDSSLGRSIVATANHVCAIKEIVTFADGTTMKHISSSISVMTAEGYTYSAEVVYSDENNDVCILAVDGIAGDQVSLADRDPPLGAKVYNVGAPHGYFGRYLVIASEGRFAGVDGDGDLVISNPSAPGASGSGIFYRGKLFCILTKVEARYGHITFCTNINYLRGPIRNSSRKWLKRK